MQINAVGKTDVGRKREFNEDAFAVHMPAGLMALADGMGGHAAGEVAARIAIETLSDVIAGGTSGTTPARPKAHGAAAGAAVNGAVSARGGVRAGGTPAAGVPATSAEAHDPAERLRAAVSLANEKIFSEIEQHEELRGMGTTLVAALAHNDHLCVAHVGDSRAYLCRGGEIRQITDDHSWVNEQVGLGLLSRQEAQRHPFRNVITRALGSREDVAPDIAELALEPDDTVLLCSDGLTTMLEDDEILAILMRHAGDPAGAADELIHRANESGGEDNITVIVAGASRG
jgi:protein phosphatase